MAAILRERRVQLVQNLHTYVQLLKNLESPTMDDVAEHQFLVKMHRDMGDTEPELQAMTTKATLQALRQHLQEQASVPPPMKRRRVERRRR